MKNNNKGIHAFNTIYIGGVIFATFKLIDYLQWTFQLVKKWELPAEPFFSKVSLVGADTTISIGAYLFFAMAYILAFALIFLGLYQLNNSTKLLLQEQIFRQEVSAAFKKAGHYFLGFAIGTLLIDIAFLAWAQTSSMFVELLSTELLVFFIMGYLMYFLSDVFKKGIHLQEENELTI